MAKKYNDETSFFNLFNAEEVFEQQEENDDAVNTENFVSILDAGNDESENADEHVPMQTTMFDNENFFCEDTFSENSHQETILTIEEVTSEKETAKIEEIVIEEVNETIEEVDAVIKTVAEENTEQEEFTENNFEVTPLKHQEEIIKEPHEITPAEDVIEEPEIIEEPVIEETESGYVEDNSSYVEKTDNFEEEQMVSMLETNPLDETYPPQQTENVNEAVAEPTIFDNLLTYSEIKKQTRSENFETPYLYEGKTSEHIRYRLQLPTKRNRKGNRLKKNMISWIITIVSAILIAILLRTFVFVIATVDGPSMQPTLEHGEKLFVTKYTYVFSDVQRGDIVICRYGTEAYPQIYVKRVIAVGGDVVSIVDGNVLINGAVLEEDYILDAPALDMDPVYVPEGSVFVMGDNRNNSADSRKSIIGPLREELIVGKVRFRVSPLNKFGALED